MVEHHVYRGRPWRSTWLTAQGRDWAGGQEVHFRDVPALGDWKHPEATTTLPGVTKLVSGVKRSACASFTPLACLRLGMLGGRLLTVSRVTVFNLMQMFEPNKSRTQVRQRSGGWPALRAWLLPGEILRTAI